MNFKNILADLLAGQGAEALADRAGISVDDAVTAASNIAPILASAAKRRLGTVDGAVGLAGLLRANDAADAAEAPTNAPEAVETQGARLLDQLFGDQRPQVEAAAAEKASAATGLDLGPILKMLPMLAGLFLGSLQKQESGDAGLSGVVGALLGGGQSDDGAAASGLGGMLGAAMGALGGATAAGGTPDLGALAGLFDADDEDGGVEDLIGKFFS